VEEDEEDSGRIPMADEDQIEDEEISTAVGQVEASEASNQPPSLTAVDILESEADDLSGEEQEEKARLIAQVS